jgi:muramidase (phage lysozyme)
MTRIKTNPNIAAFLDMIAHSEGTAMLGDDGYNVVVGGTLFNSYADHPRRRVTVRPGLISTAAGRYQLLARYFDDYRSELHLPDFSPASQDAIAIQQIRECKAIAAIEAGEFAQAVALCAHIWASLPGAGYGQHENMLAEVQAAYVAAGGTVAS